MKKIAWITDSTCGLPQEFIEENDIHVVPLNVIINGVSYKEDVDITKEEFYQKLQEPDVDAKTSQASLGDFLELYERLKEEYDCGIAIHASSKLTGMYNSSRVAGEQTGFPVEVIDSKIGNYALGKMIRNGIALEKKGLSYEEIVARMRKFPALAEMYLLPSSMEQLKKSGRVSLGQAILASILNINLLLRFQEGKVVVEEKIRSKKKAKNRLFEIVEKAVEKYELEEICVMHAGVIDKANAWKEELEKMHDQLRVKIKTLVPVAGVHTGYGTMAISWLSDGDLGYLETH